MENAVIQFPAAVVPLRFKPSHTAASEMSLLAVEHDGAVHSLATLLARLPNDVLDELDALVPRSAQEIWDLVVRRWPKLAKAVAYS